MRVFLGHGHGNACSSPLAFKLCAEGQVTDRQVGVTDVYHKIKKLHEQSSNITIRCSQAARAFEGIMSLLHFSTYKCMSKLIHNYILSIIN